MLSGIKGEARRQLVLQRLESGATGDLPEGFLDSQLDEKTRKAWGAIHPLMMGGEYLPDDHFRWVLAAEGSAESLLHLALPPRYTPGVDAAAPSLQIPGVLKAFDEPDFVRP